MPSLNSFKSKQTLSIHGKKYHYFNLITAEKNGLKGISTLPFSLKILLENQLRHEDEKTTTKADIQGFIHWLKEKKSDHEIAYRPSRVLMQDFTGVPAVVDLAAMRDAMHQMQGNPQKINPLCPVDLIIDHSVQAEKFGDSHAFTDNVHLEMKRNHERYAFLKWGQHSFNQFQLVPPGTGICHQVNLEYLGKGVAAQPIDDTEQEWIAFPDTVVGTDSHTTMINGLGVLGWGVGGIEAEAAMLGQPVSMLIPEVIGFEIKGKLKEGVTATDLVLTITQMLREKGVVGKFVEFYGSGIAELSLPNRATIANMAPEYGATCGLFPIDQETINYMTLTGRDPAVIELVEAYTKAQGMWHDPAAQTPTFTDTMTLDLGTVTPSLSGPRRPQDKVNLPDLKAATEEIIAFNHQEKNKDNPYRTKDAFDLHHGDVVIAAITSCTNTSNPDVMMAAGLLAKKAVEKGLQPKPWVKASLAPGSKVVTDYLQKAGLTPYLEKMGFYLVGYGCTTCIGNSGPLLEPIANSISENNLVVSAVLSGNRNFEGRIHPQVKANWLASPPLVVAFALAGTTKIDLTTTPIGKNEKGEAIYLKDIWPKTSEIKSLTAEINDQMYHKEYAKVFDGDQEWQAIAVTTSNTYQWDAESTYVKNPPYFDNMTATPQPIQPISNARILLLLGDSVTTDHISPAGAIPADSPAGKYLKNHGTEIKDFNSYGSRRGNHEVLMRGTFANIRIRNELLDNVEGGYTKHFPSQQQMPVFDAAMQYQQEQVPLVVIAGQEYGTGSSRDWAAKGPLLLGVKAIVAESFERIHRSNLIGMGILPLEFKPCENRKTLKLTGEEIISFPDLGDHLKPQDDVKMTIQYPSGDIHSLILRCRIDTQNELQYYSHGGILQYVLRKMLNNS